MRLPCVRYTVRRMMVAVAALAVILWATKMRRLSEYYLERASVHSEMLQWIDQKAAEIRRMRMRQNVPVAVKEQMLSSFVEKYQPWIDYHTLMREKCLRAARWPRESTPPDPPMPSL